MNDTQTNTTPDRPKSNPALLWPGMAFMAAGMLLFMYYACLRYLCKAAEPRTHPWFLASMAMMCASIWLNRCATPSSRRNKGFLVVAIVVSVMILADFAVRYVL